MSSRPKGFYSWGKESCSHLSVPLALGFLGRGIWVLYIWALIAPMLLVAGIVGEWGMLVLGIAGVNMSIYT